MKNMKFILDCPLAKRIYFLKMTIFNRRFYRSYISSNKLLIFVLILLLIIIYLIYQNETNGFCNPEEPLWWFCSWPDPKTTVCSWDEHFPLLKPKHRSPEVYDELLKSSLKIRSSFEFNNKTLVKCEENSIDLLIFVISKCSHSSIRQTIRRTWANKNLLKKFYRNFEIKVLFLVDVDSQSKNQIELEHFHHKDLVQVINLPQDYSYVTQRESSIYDFINKNCQQIKYLFKTDDDIFLNTFLLLNYLQTNSLELKTTNYFLSGFGIEYGLVVRHTNNFVGQRYIITKYEYSCSRYPLFLSGFGYLMSINTTKLFLNAYLTDSEPFPLSDVYFTGLLSQMFNIERKNLFENIDFPYEETCREEFFNKLNSILLCAASNDHFQKEKSNQENNFMNFYNLYWTKLIHLYETNYLSSQ